VYGVKRARSLPFRAGVAVAGILAWTAGFGAPTEQQAAAIRDCVQSSTTPEQAIVLARWQLLENYATESGFSDLFVTPDIALEKAETEAAAVAGVVLAQRCLDPIRSASGRNDGGTALGTAFGALIAQAARARPSQANSERSMRMVLGLAAAMPKDLRAKLEYATDRKLGPASGVDEPRTRLRVGPGTSDPVAAAFAPGPAFECPYPPDARRANEAGSVVVVFYVDAEGRPSDLRVQTSSGSQRLDDATVFCLSRQRFKPASPNGVPTGAYQRIRWTWKLDD
jgi:TonB family protein